MNYKSMLRTMSRFGIKYFPLKGLKESIKNSSLPIVFEIYAGKMILFAIITFLGTLLVVPLAMTFLGAGIIISLLTGIISAIIGFLLVMIAFYFYPSQLMKFKKTSLEANMPFSMSHMAAIASSGVPPYIMFKLLGSIKEYGEIAKEAARVVRNIDIFGMDITSAIKNVANRTSSSEYKKFLHGVVSTVETGGSLTKYLENSSKDAMFDYKLKREKYLQALSTYADIYTAVLIAAPLFFVSVLSIMALIGGQIFGISIPVALRVGIYGFIPLMNIAFLLFIHYTQPNI